MANKTNLIQAIVDRLTNRKNAGTSAWLRDIKQIRVGSLEEARKQNDLPILNIQLESGQEDPNYQNAAGIDTMSINITLLHPKLTQTANTLFRYSDGNGDIWSVAANTNLSVGSSLSVLEFAAGTRSRSLTAGTDTGGDIVTYDPTDSESGSRVSGDLTIGASTDVGIGSDVGLLEWLAGIRERTLSVDASDLVVLEYPTTGNDGFSVEEFILSDASDPGVGSSVSVLSYLATLQKSVITVTDTFLAQKTQTSLVTTTSPVTSDSATIGTEPKGALVMLEYLMNSLDLNDSGAIDISIGSTAHNLRQLGYTVDESNDAVEINLRVQVESKIFTLGAR